MIVQLNQDNKLELTDKAMMIRDFRELYKYYADKLNSEDRAMASFGILYYMYFFDSRFLAEHPKNEEKRLLEVQQFVYQGDKVNTSTKVFKKAAKTYKTLMNEEQSSIYLIMKDNIEKMKDYAKQMVLTKESEDPTEEELATDSIPQNSTVKVTYKEFKEVNASLPEQEEILRKFRDKLMTAFKNEIDIYGGGDLGAYER